MPENMLGFPGNPGMLGPQEEAGLPGMLEEPRSLERLRRRVTEARRYANLPYSERHPEMPGLGFTEEPTAMQMLSMRLKSPFTADRQEGVRDVLNATVDAVVPAGLGAMAWQAMKGNRALPPISGTFGGPAFHGSPHRFDKFDIDKIGTGEGAQAYGHGLYFAESPGVAGSYKTRLSNQWRVKGSEVSAPDWRAMGLDGEQVEMMNDVLTRAKGDRRAAATLLDQQKTHHRGFSHEWNKRDDVAKMLRGAKDDFEPNVGTLYEVDIPDEQISQMLDWDKPLSEQPESVRQLAAEVFVQETGMPPGHENYTGMVGSVRKQMDDSGKTGKDLYKALALQKRDYSIMKLDDYNARLAALSKEMDADSGGGYRNFRSDKGRNAAAEYDRLMDERARVVPVGSMDLEGAQKAASQELQELGIPGIKYLDQASRGKASVGPIEQNLAKARAKLTEWTGKTDQVATAQQAMYRKEIALLEKNLETAKAAPSTRNLVLFSDENINILKRDGKGVGFRRAGEAVDGLTVGEDVPNTSSIRSTFDAGEYDELPGIRTISMDDIPNTAAKDLFYAADDMQRVSELASEIKASGRIDPLIVVKDKEGLYVLEGAHRLGALDELGKTEFPAVVIEAFD